METIHLPHLPPQYALHVCLLAHVENAPDLRRHLLQGNAEFEYAFLDASVLLSRKHLLAACFRAVTDLIHHRLKSRNVHSEIVFALSPTNNIAEAFRRFGIQDTSKDIVAIKVGGDGAAVEAHLLQNVMATLSPFSDERLAATRDPAKLRNIYRLAPPKKDFSSPQWDTHAEPCVLGSMALKGS